MVTKRWFYGNQPSDIGTQSAWRQSSVERTNAMRTMSIQDYHALERDARPAASFHGELVAGVRTADFHTFVIETATCEYARDFMTPVVIEPVQIDMRQAITAEAFAAQAAAAEPICSADAVIAGETHPAAFYRHGGTVLCLVMLPDGPAAFALTPSS
jgi:hypothetical protein